MLKFRVIEDFINEIECKELIEEATRFLEIKSENEIISNNRQMIISTSVTYNELLKNSKNWEKLHEKINSHQFYQECLKNFDLNPNQFELRSFFFKKELSNIEKRYKNLVNKKFSYLETGTLFKLLLFRAYKQILFKIELVDKDKKNIPAQPKDKNCRIMKTLSPKAGNLVLFLNTADAFHSVSEMIGEEKRYFLYGSYTALNKKNPLIKNSADKLKTDFFLLH